MTERPNLDEIEARLRDGYTVPFKGRRDLWIIHECAAKQDAEVLAAYCRQLEAKLARVEAAIEEWPDTLPRAWEYYTQNPQGNYAYDEALNDARDLIEEALKGEGNGTSEL